MDQKNLGYCSARSAGELVAELGGDADLDELVVERVELAGMVGVAELADQVGGAHQGRLAAGLGIIVAFGDRKAGELDRPRDPLGVQVLDHLAAVADEDLAALDMVGGEERVRGAARRLDRVALGVDHVAAVPVARAGAAQVAEVVAQAWRP